MNILFYTPFNLRSRDTESLMEAFVKQGHKVSLLTQAERGIYHEHAEKVGVSAYTHVIPKKNSAVYFIKHALYLARFCRRNAIDIVYAHLETAGLPAVLAQYVIKARVYVCRHTIDEARQSGNINFLRLMRLTYALAKHVIVVSNQCKDYMVREEKVDPAKIQVIFLGYNFGLYQKPDPVKVQKLRDTYPCRMLMITACRLLPLKRPDISLRVTKKLIAAGYDVKLLVLGNGTMKEELEACIKKENLADRIFLEGFRTNVVDYLAAGDVVMHPSLIDSSSVIVKETGLCERPVVLCYHIGDADDYLVSGVNALLVSGDNTEAEMYSAAEKLYNDPGKRNELGKNLKVSVTERFSIEKILPLYDAIHAEVK